MPGYVAKALKQFQHTMTKRKNHSPYLSKYQNRIRGKETIRNTGINGTNTR